MAQLSVAFDASSGVYLVVYSTYRDEIKGQWLGADGVLRGAPFLLVAGKYPVVKYVPELGVLALNYVGGGKGKFALLRYQAPHSFAWVTSTPVEINGQLYGNDVYHDSAYAPSRGHHLVTWWDSLSNPGQSFVRVARSDGSVGDIRPLSGTTSDVFDSPQIGCGANECLVVGKYYNDSVTPRRRGAWARWLNLDGAPISDLFFLNQSTDNHELVGVSYTPARNHYQIVWVRAGGFPDALVVQPGATAGFAPYPITPYSATIPPDSQYFGGPRVAYNGGSDSFSVFLVGWFKDLFAWELNSTGAPIGGKVPVYQNDAVLNTFTALATDPALSRTLVA